MPQRLIDLTGQRFGRLVVVARLGNTAHGSLWHCRCDCGHVAALLGHHLRQRRAMSCGCRAHETRLLRQAENTTHGEARKDRESVEYLTWQRMIQRCENTRRPDYDRYGGRGIRVCAQWRRDFSAFLRAVGRRPSSQHSIDRIDVNGNYEPGNVRWATDKQQANNRRPRRRAK